MTLLEQALACPQLVISVMGAHAGESAHVIFQRKIRDIDLVGNTFWIIRSPKARPDHIQAICKTSTAHAIFVEPATKNGARPTSEANRAKEFSEDQVSWHSLPEELSPVTGKLDRSATALVFDMMTTDVRGALDLWEYADFSDTDKPIRFVLGCSTVCAVRQETESLPGKLQSRYRGIVAVARFTTPFGVWVR